MSLFNIFRRDKTSDERKPAPTPPPERPAAVPPPAQPARPAVTPPPPAPPAGSDMDLDRIRGELMEIAKIVGSDDAGATQSGVDQSTRIQLPLIEIMKLAPHAFRQISTPSPDIKITIVIPDLFDQLTTGKVNVRLSTLLAGIAPETRSAEATMHGDEPVNIPLPLVVSAISPAELQKRTAKQEVDRGEKFLPNLFTPGSLKKPVAESAPAATATPPAAPPPSASVTKPASAPSPAPESAVKLPPSSIVSSAPPPPAAKPAVATPAPVPVVPAPAPAAPAAQPKPVPPAPTPLATQPTLPAMAPAPAAPPAAPTPAPAPLLPVTAAPVASTPPPPAAPSAPPRPTAPAVSVQPAATPVAPSAPTPVSATTTPVPPAPPAAVAPPPPKPVEPVPAVVPPSPVVAPPPAAVEKPAPPAAPPAPSRAEIEAAEVREKRDALEREELETVGREHGLILYGLDINRASAEEMVARFNGVGRKLAEKIVANRVESGPFKDVYDIARVPGVKGKVFQRITGMVWPAQLFRHREQVARLVGVVGDAIPDVRGVAQRFRELDGFTGCIMIDQDGLVLASTWDHPSSEPLGAFAPQMFKKLSRYVKQLKMGEIKTLTFFTEDQPVTLVTSGAILFVAVHKASRFSKRQVELIQALCTELGRKLRI